MCWSTADWKAFDSWKEKVSGELDGRYGMPLKALVTKAEPNTLKGTGDSIFTVFRAKYPANFGTVEPGTTPTVAAAEIAKLVGLKAIEQPKKKSAIKTTKVVAKAAATKAKQLVGAGR